MGAERRGSILVGATGSVTSADMTVNVRERDKELSLVQHLGELPDRLMVAGIALIVTTGIAFYFGTPIIRFLLVPADCQFITTDVCHDPRTHLVPVRPPAH